MYKISVGGKTQTNDLWVNTVHASARNGATVGTTDSIDHITADNLQKLYDLFKAAYINGDGLQNYSTLEYVKVAAIDPSGHYIGDAKVLAPAAVQGQGQFNVAPQDSVVVSLKTAKRSGAGSKTRIFLPAGFAGTTPNGFLNGGSINNIATVFQNLITEINKVTIEGGNKLTVTTAPKNNTSEVNTVTQVLVGNRMDTQRRRRNRLQETYVSKDINTADF